ncbi:hypothetical protein P3S68_026118 [Capsicum galapagoense]
MKVPNKMKHFLWLLNHNRLLCNPILARRGIPITPYCNCCNTTQEDIFHNFWNYPKASQLWSNLFNRLGCNRPNLDGMTADNMLGVVKNRDRNKIFDAHISIDVLFVFYLWEIWKCRNDNIFNNSNYTPIFDNAYASAVEYTHLTNHPHTQQQPPIIILVKWSPPSRNYYKLNTDGSSLGNPGIGGIGGVIRNSNGEWIVGYYKGYPKATNSQMEILALLERLKIVEENNLHPTEININSQHVIYMLKHGNMHYDPIIDLCRSILTRVRRLAVQQCFREQNQVADSLAKEGAHRRIFGTKHILEVPPVFALEHVWADILGTCFNRSVKANSMNLSVDHAIF